MVLLPETDEVGARAIAELLRQSVLDLALPHENGGEGQFVTISVGVCTLKPPPSLSPEQLLKSADLALYQAKKNGRNQVNAGGSLA